MSDQARSRARVLQAFPAAVCIPYGKERQFGVFSEAGNLEPYAGPFRTAAGAWHAAAHKLRDAAQIPQPDLAVTAGKPTYETMLTNELKRVSEDARWGDFALLLLQTEDAFRAVAMSQECATISAVRMLLGGLDLIPR